MQLDAGLLVADVRGSGLFWIGFLPLRYCTEDMPTRKTLRDVASLQVEAGVQADERYMLAVRSVCPVHRSENNHQSLAVSSSLDHIVTHGWSQIDFPFDGRCDVHLPEP